MREGMVQVAGVAVTAALLAGVLRKGTPELALLLTLAAGVWMLWSVARSLEGVLALMDRLGGLAGLEGEVVEPVVKTVALSVLTKLTGEVCRGAGENSLAAFVEVAGTVAALGVALPLVEGVVELMGGMLT